MFKNEFEMEANMNGPAELVQRLVHATNARDIDALVDCFDDDYVNETPSHPARSFRGRAQVRSNWQQIFEFVADLHVEVTRCAVDGDTAWTEWVMRGTRRDLTAHHLSLDPPWWFGVDGWRVREKCPLSSEDGGLYTNPFRSSGGHLSDAIFAQSRHHRCDLR